MFDFDRSLILVFGAQGSGTTRLQQVLASHSLIAAGQESQLFSGYLGPWWQRWQDEQRLEKDGSRTSGLGCYLNEEELLEEMRILTRRILGRVRYLKPAAELIVETTPDHGLQLPLIHALFPDATVIHVVREGQDQSLEAIRRDAKLFRRHHEIRYENLIDNDSQCIAEVFDFLGFPLSGNGDVNNFRAWAIGRTQGDFGARAKRRRTACGVDTREDGISGFAR